MIKHLWGLRHKMNILIELGQSWGNAFTILANKEGIS